MAATDRQQVSSPTRRPMTRSLHCPTPTCNGLIIGIVPRTARGYLELDCCVCRKTQKFVLVDPRVHRIVEAEPIAS